MARIGYARASSYGHSLEMQLQRLGGCHKIFCDEEPVPNDKRPQLQLCLDSVQECDFVVVTRLDRLARSTQDLLNIVNRLESQSVKLVVLDQRIDTSADSGRHQIAMLHAIAELENDLQKDMAQQAKDLAKRKGVKFGRKAALSSDQISELRRLRADGMTIVELIKHFRLSRASLYRALARAVP
jgi:DNA invertase Pin-like site-specific DNA recombinase